MNAVRLVCTILDPFTGGPEVVAVQVRERDRSRAGEKRSTRP